MTNIAIELFNSSNPSVTTKLRGKPLGDLATEIVCNITALLDSNPAAMDLLENPTLHAYGNIEQTYLDLLKKAREMTTVGRGEWPMLLRAMTIPLSDELFLDRQSQTEALGVSRIGKLFLEKIRAVESDPNIGFWLVFAGASGTRPSPKESMKQFQEEVTEGNAVPLSAEDEALLNPAIQWGGQIHVSHSTARVDSEIEPGIQPGHDAEPVADYDSKESVDIPDGSNEPGAASVIHLPGPVSAPSGVRIAREDHSRH